MEEPKVKKKREPNKWQLFLTDCIKTTKGSSLGEKVSTCSVVYKDLKIKDPKKLDEIVELAKQKRVQKSQIQSTAEP
jgi:hypothetical protein